MREVMLHVFTGNTQLSVSINLIIIEIKQISGWAQHFKGVLTVHELSTLFGFGKIPEPSVQWKYERYRL